MKLHDEEQKKTWITDNTLECQLGSIVQYIILFL